MTHTRDGAIVISGRGTLDHLPHIPDLTSLAAHSREAWGMCGVSHGRSAAPACRTMRGGRTHSPQTNSFAAIRPLGTQLRMAELDRIAA